jgi:pimeloyl-ACP methyl ester carboxylesterase
LGKNLGRLTVSPPPFRESITILVPHPLSVLACDPPRDRHWPAKTLAQAIPIDGVNLNAVLYVATGSGPHPCVLLLHGLPGKEQNVDCAQAMRRSGWNVLTIHYRGSWGGPGSFSFAHCLDDARAALEWLQLKGREGDLRTDPARIVLVGHSMGGFVAANVVASHPEVLGAALLSGVDLGDAFGQGGTSDVNAIDANVGFGAGLHILAGTSPGSLAREARAHSSDWALSSYAAALKTRPVLLISSDDGFVHGSDALADAIERRGGTLLRRAHLADDHSYSNSRIALQTILLDWLQAFRKEHELTCANSVAALKAPHQERSDAG